MSTTTTPPAAVRSFRDVWLIAGGHAFTHWYPATFYILLPLIGRELGFSYSEIGLVMTVQHLAGAISNIPGGIFVDAMGHKGRLMAVSLFWVGVPYAFMSLAPSFWFVLVCAALVGIGNNLWHPAAISTLAHNHHDRKGLVLSYHGMGGNVGEALAPLAIGALLAVYTWRQVVVINVVPGVVMAAFILAFLGAIRFKGDGPHNAQASGERRDSGDFLRGFASLFKNRELMLISLSSGFRTMTQIGLLTFLPVFLAYELGYSPFAVGIVMTLMQVAGFVAGPIGGHISDKIGRKQVILSSMAATAVVIVAMALAGRTAAFVVFVGILGFFLYAVRAVLQAWTIESTPKGMAGSAIGVLFGIQALGAAISPVIFGIVADRYDVFTAFYFLAGTIVIANLLVFFTPSGKPAHAAAY